MGTRLPPPMAPDTARRRAEALTDADRAADLAAHIRPVIDEARRAALDVREDGPFLDFASDLEGALGTLMGHVEDAIPTDLGEAA